MKAVNHGYRRGLLALGIGLVGFSTLICGVQRAHAVLIDDFSGSLAPYTDTVILDANGGATNTASWAIVGGQLQLQTSAYDGIQQHAFIYGGLTLNAGQEVQVDAAVTGNQDLGLYVGGTTPSFNTRTDYVNSYARGNGELYSRGFDGGSEYALAGVGVQPYDRLFIARTAANTYEAGYYDGTTRIIMASRTPTTPNDGDVVGFYADVRAGGTLGSVDNLAVNPVTVATIYQETFGGGGGALNTNTTDDVGSGALTAWSANNFVNDNGTFNAANEGSALLPFAPVANAQYSLQMDVTAGDTWIGLGFARDPLLSAGASNVNDRLANEPEGLAWMLFRDVANDADDAQVFAGLRVANGIADSWASTTAGSTYTLRIDIDTTGDGSSFTADFLVDGGGGFASIVGGPQLINIHIDDINYAGFSYDNTASIVPSVDNFLLWQSVAPVPEPTGLALAGIGLAGLGLALWRRHWK